MDLVPKTGSVRDQKRAVYQKWLDGAFINRAADVLSLLPEVRHVVMEMDGILLCRRTNSVLRDFPCSLASRN